MNKTPRKTLGKHGPTKHRLSH